MRNNILLRCIGLLMLLLNLAACVSSSPGLIANIQAAKYLNPDIDGMASPVVITFYQLKSPFNFNNADYDSLATNSASALGSTLIDKQTTEIRPSETTTLKLELSQGTQYIGIVAAYRNIEHTRWHTAIKLPQGSNTLKLAINLESAGLNVYRVKH